MTKTYGLWESDLWIFDWTTESGFLSRTFSVLQNCDFGDTSGLTTGTFFALNISDSI